MNVLEQLEPKSVFRFFEEMCAIPHGSRNTKAVSDWCADFAQPGDWSTTRTETTILSSLRRLRPAMRPQPR